MKYILIVGGRRWRILHQTTISVTQVTLSGIKKHQQDQRAIGDGWRRKWRRN